MGFVTETPDAYAKKIVGAGRTSGRMSWCRKGVPQGTYDKITDQIVAKQK